jgi:hypothetical protein
MGDYDTVINNNLLARVVRSSVQLTTPVGTLASPKPAGSLAYNAAAGTMNYSDGNRWVGMLEYTEPARSIRVAQQDGEFDNLADAVAQAISLNPTEDNGVKIVVYPGTYKINNPLDLPAFVTVTTAGVANRIVILLAANSADTLLNMERNSFINGLHLINGDVGCLTKDGRIGIMNCSFQGCARAIVGVGAAVDGEAFVDNCSFDSVGGALWAEDNFTITATNLTIRSVGQAFGNLGTSHIDVFGASLERVTTAITTESTQYLQNVQFRTITEGFINGVVDMNNCVITEPKTVFKVDKNCTIRGNGNQFHPLNIQGDGNIQLGTYSDEGQSIVGNISLGDTYHPTTTYIGEGRPYTRGIIAFRGSTDVAGNFLSYEDITEEVISDQSVKVFADENINGEFVLGSRELDFTSFELYTEDGFLSNSSSRVIMESFTSVGWVPMPFMSVVNNTAQGDEALIQDTQATYRLGGVLNALPLLAVNGVSGHFIRFRRIITDPQSVSVRNTRLIGSTVKVSPTGFKETFGQSQGSKKIDLFTNTSSSANSPATIAQNLYYTSTISVARTFSSFSTAVDSQFATDTFALPYDMDTGKGLVVELRTTTPTVIGGSSSIQLQVSLYKTNPALVFFSAGTAPATPAGITRTATIGPSIAPLGTVVTTRLSFDTSTYRGGTPLVPGDIMALNIGRIAQFVSDYNDSMILLSATAIYTSWCDGGVI